MFWNGKEYRPGIISEMMYEDFIDKAYGRGHDLRDTKLWKKGYVAGFVCPDGNGGFDAFVRLQNGYRYLGCYSYDDLFDEEEENVYDWKNRMLAQADSMPVERGICTLREIYLHPEFRNETSKVGLRIADDPQCMEWFIDYWKYVHWNERGNECFLSEVGFGGFVDTILDPSYVLEYLLPEGCETRDGEILAARLRMLNQRYTVAR